MTDIATLANAMKTIKVTVQVPEKDKEKLIALAAALMRDYEKRLRICPQCGERFYADRMDKTYCSTSCRVMASRGRKSK